MSASTNKPPTRTIDSHIHLWPSTSVTSQNHGWMVPGHHLSKRHGIQDYNTVTNSLPSGFIYVETDRYLPRSAPEISALASEEEQTETLKQWASEKLEELKFLRRIVEGTPSEGDGFAKGDGEKMLGTVIWAPFDLSPKLFQLYLKIAEEVSGEAAWKRVVGFRFLLQGKGEGEVKRLVSSEEWVENVASLGSRWGFDVGVDVHRDGVEQLEYVVGMVERVRKIEKNGSVRFILNHLCKPDLSTSPESSATFSRWTTALTTLSSDPQITMKLSGAFNEFSPLQTPSSIPDLLTALRPYLNHIFKCFPKRVMFGSDWPVCNVGGPNGEAGNWGLWVKVVEAWCEELGLSEEERGDVWWGAAKRAYEVEV